MPHRWTLFLRGEDGKTTAGLGIKEVVFHIHQDYTPSSVHVKKAPFEITRNGYGAFEVAADVTRVDGTATRELWSLNFDKPESFRVCGEDEWKMSGHRWIGQSVPRVIGGKTVFCKVTRWMPPGNDPKEDFALWHIVHSDGDEEDLEEWEVREALALARQLKQKTAGKSEEEKEDPGAPAEEDEWKEDGHDWIGKKVLRVLEGGLIGRRSVKATVTRWMPPGADPVEDFAMWHIVHADGDEEDLEEHEMVQALKNLAEAEENEEDESAQKALKVSDVSTDAWSSVGHSWVGREVTRYFNGGERRVNGKVTRWLEDKANPVGGPLWHIVHTDGDEEDLNEDDMREAMRQHMLWTMRRKGCA